MKTFLFASLCLINSFLVSAVNHKSYILYIVANQSRLLLNFQEPNKYSILLDINYKETAMSICLSDGIYVEHNDTIICFDNKFKYSLILLDLKDRIKVVKGYIFITNKEFYCSQDNDISICTNSYMMKKVYASDTLLKKNEQLIEFDTGVYEIEDLYIYNLSFFNNLTFYYKLNDLIISKGHWYRRNNILELYDSVFNIKYYLQITKDGLVNSDQMPGFISNNNFVHKNSEKSFFNKLKGY